MCLKAIPVSTYLQAGADPVQGEATADPWILKKKKKSPCIIRLLPTSQKKLPIPGCSLFFFLTCVRWEARLSGSPNCSGRRGRLMGIGPNSVRCPVVTVRSTSRFVRPLQYSCLSSIPNLDTNWTAPTMHRTEFGSMPIGHPPGLIFFA